MTRILLLSFLLIEIALKSQIQFAAGCNQSTLNINTVFLPNTTTSYSNATIPAEVLYLCGPNTIVIDTISKFHLCRNVLINPGCIYYTNSGGCTWSEYILAKNNSTVVVSSTSWSGINIYYEPGATIIDYSVPGAQTFSCASLTFPTASCYTGIYENNLEQFSFIIYPNPANSKIIIKIFNFDNQFVDLSIANQLGELVLHRKKWAISENEIPIDNFSNGLYYVQIKTSHGQRNEKLIINR